jgi:flagellar biosynthetic protein FliS
MNPYLAYRRNDEPAGWTRIDMLLALYDGALTRLDRAEAALKAGEAGTAAGFLSRAQLIISSLASDVRPDVNPEAGANMLRLYEYAVNELRRATVESVGNVRKVLRTLRAGFEAVRAEANELERTGRLPAAAEARAVHVTA